MIVEFILGALQTVVDFLFGWLPSIPSIPSDIMDGINTFTASVSDVVGLISYLYTPVVFGLVFGLLIAILLFDPILAFIKWVYHYVKP